ncbi:hypothetical protein LG634_18055 [Streptomyces bambusae]|nr:DUF6777 domain-containing protein [Streptomyces bambusae]MCB5166736.1 hypothetical protein [Streptomyces bambusae]
MTTQPSGRPPSGDRPTGPPSGPLSGSAGQGPPTIPHGGVPPAPPGGGGGGDGSGTGPGPGDGNGKPWWRSVPRIATAALALVAAVVLAVVLTRPGGTPKSGGEVFLQAASAEGPDPYTASTVTPAGKEKQQTQEPPPPPASTPPPGGRIVTQSVAGSAPGLYGGTKNVASCNVELQIKTLGSQPPKNTAFASALGIQPAAVPGYLRSLTTVQLRSDTRVTNHGYRDGRPTSYQAVLQAGTAVLVDSRGVPRVRCACGNPLGPPVALQGDPVRKGQAWPSYRPVNVVVIAPSVTIINKFVIYDRDDRRWYERDRGDHHGRHDRPVPPPPDPSPWVPEPVTSPPSPDDSLSPPDEEPVSPADSDSGTPSEDTESPGRNNLVPDDETSSGTSEPASSPADEPAAELSSEPASEPPSSPAPEPASEPASEPAPASSPPPPPVVRTPCPVLSNGVVVTPPPAVGIDPPSPCPPVVAPPPPASPASQPAPPPPADQQTTASAEQQQPVDPGQPADQQDGGTDGQ